MAQTKQSNKEESLLLLFPLQTPRTEQSSVHASHEGSLARDSHIRFFLTQVSQQSLLPFRDSKSVETPRGEAHLLCHYFSCFNWAKPETICSRHKREAARIVQCGETWGGCRDLATGGEPQPRPFQRSRTQTSMKQYPKHHSLCSERHLD